MQIENNDLPLGNPNEIINDYQRIDIDRDEGTRDYELSPLATIPKHVVPPFPSTTIENSPTTTVPGMPGIGFG